MKKLGTILIVFLLLSSAVFYASASFNSKPKTTFHINLSNSVFLGVDGLDSNIVGYKSSVDISEYLPHSNCNIKSAFLGQAEDIYFYHIKYLNACSNSTLLLQKDGINIFSSMHTFKFFSPYDIYNKFTDYSSASLEEIMGDLSKKQGTLKAYKNITSQNASNFLAIKKKRKYDEVTYVHGIISNILESRDYPYLIPIPGYNLPTQKSHMPNFSRAYRKDYTDGIHHGWDIFAPNESPIQAIDSGIIVHVVEGFEFSDLKNIKRGTLTEMEKLENLNMLRGNQVWLKTMKGEIVFYSHLTDIEEGIEVGMLVPKGAKLGTTGISGIPTKGYTDYHLHFAIQKNPYNIYKAGKYTLSDYMAWDWLLKDLTMNEVKEKQKDIFVK